MIMSNGKWNFFVLDFDYTYDNEEPGSDGVQPLVYLVPNNRLSDVEHYAKMAHNDFHSDENGEIGLTITEYFEEWMENNDCNYRRIGKIDLTFEERMGNYLADCIPGAIV